MIGSKREQNMIAEGRALTGENCRFSLSPAGLLLAELTDGSYRGRAFLSLAFPFQLTDAYIALQNEDKEEIGMIRSLSDLREEDQTLVREELATKYFTPKIRKILALTERFGTTRWTVETDKGEMRFIVKDTYKSLIRVSEDRLFVCDLDGCRYEVVSLKALDRKSYSRIELYI